MGLRVKVMSVLWVNEEVHKSVAKKQVSHWRVRGWTMCWLSCWHWMNQGSLTKHEWGRYFQTGGITFQPGSLIQAWTWNFHPKALGQNFLTQDFLGIYIYRYICFLLPINCPWILYNYTYYCLAKTWSFKRSLLSQLIFPINTCGHPR